MELAMKEFKEIQFNIDWLPFFLTNPNEVSDAEPIGEVLKRKYGGQRYLQIKSMLQQAGEEVGIHWDEKRVSRNTLNSHRLVEFSKRYNKQNEIIERIFQSYFEKNANIEDITVLAELARSVGIEPAETITYLKSDEGRDKVIYEASQNRVSGVPTFSITSPSTTEKEKKFSGAQDPAVFVSAFNYILGQ